MHGNGCHGLDYPAGSCLVREMRKGWLTKPIQFMIQSLEELYLDQIGDLYDAETQLIALLPQLATYSTCDPLREAFNHHLSETHNHRERLVKIMERRSIQPGTVACDAMKGLITETKKHLTETVPGDVRDAVLIACANRIEHYEIAGYGVAKAFATCLGFDDDADLLDETLQEEGAADAALTKIATGGIFTPGVNAAASHS